MEHTLIGNFIELLVISDVQFQYEAGRVPRTVECEVSDDLVSSCSPGDEVTIVGIVKVSSTNNVFVFVVANILCHKKSDF